MMQAVHVLGHDVREGTQHVERDRGEVRLGRFGVLEPRHGHRASLRLLRPYAVPASKVGDRGRCGEPRSRVHDEGPTLTNQLNQYRHVLHHDFGWILALLEALLGLRLASQRALHVGHQRRHHGGMLIQQCQSLGVRSPGGVDRTFRIRASSASRIARRSNAALASRLRLDRPVSGLASIVNE